MTIYGGFADDADMVKAKQSQLVAAGHYPARDGEVCWKCGAQAVARCPEDQPPTWCGQPECEQRSHEYEPHGPQPQVKQSALEIDPLEFWRDLAAVLGHARPERVNPVSLIAEVGRRIEFPEPQPGAEAEAVVRYCQSDVPFAQKVGFVESALTTAQAQQKDVDAGIAHMMAAGEDATTGRLKALAIEAAIRAGGKQ